MSSDSSPDEIASTRRTSRPKQVGWAVTLLAGGAVAGAVLAGNLPAFADNANSPSASSGSGAEQGNRGDRGGHDEVALTGDAAAKAKAAALAKVPGATVERVEKDADGATYEAHLTRSDGTRATVKMDTSFNVTAVESGGPEGRGHHGPGGAEAALSGVAAAKVEAAALAKVPGATVERVEKDADGASYEAHLTRPDGTRVTVKVDGDFKATGVEIGR